MEHVPILKIDDFLLVRTPTDMYDRVALAMQDDISKEVIRTGAKGVVIDISELSLVDSFTARVLGNTSSIVRLLGADAVVTGMQPAVAITLSELGLSLEGVHMALNATIGLESLRAAAQSNGSEETYACGSM